MDTGITCENCDMMIFVLEGVFNIIALELALRRHVFQEIVMRVFNDMSQKQNHEIMANEQTPFVMRH